MIIIWWSSKIQHKLYIFNMLLYKREECFRGNSVDKLGIKESLSYEKMNGRKALAAVSKRIKKLLSRFPAPVSDFSPIWEVYNLISHFTQIHNTHTIGWWRQYSTRTKHINHTLSLTLFSYSHSQIPIFWLIIVDCVFWSFLYPSLFDFFVIFFCAKKRNKKERCFR